MAVSKPLRVLIVRADWMMSTLLQAALCDEGMLAEVVDAGLLAIPKKRAFRPDVIVIGWGAIGLGAAARPPWEDALALIEGFAREGDCGVMVVSGHVIDGAHVASLDAGADDYVVEPVAVRELASRIRAVHRRMSRAQASWRTMQIRVDISRRALLGPGDVMSTLTEAEFALFRELLRADGSAVSREWLGQVALKRALRDDDRSVDQLVLKLRRKLAKHGLAERAVLSTRGLGYSMPDPGLFDMPASPIALPPMGSPMPPMDVSDHRHRGAGALQP